MLILVTGEILYQDPKTKIEYDWDTERNSWKQQGEDSNATPEYDFDGKTYLHTGKQLICFAISRCLFICNSFS